MDAAGTGTVGERIYGLAVRRQGISAREAAAELGVGQAEAERAVAELAGHGLLSRLPEAPGTWLPTTAQAAEARLLAPLFATVERCQQETRQIRERMQRYAEVHDAAAAEAYGADPVQPLPSATSIAVELGAALRRCESEVLTVHPGADPAASALESAWWDGEHQLDRGVRRRALYQSTARFNIGLRRRMECAASAGTRVRTVAGSLERAVVVDRKLAFIASGQGQGGACAVRDPATVQYLVAVFEARWDGGRDYAGRRPSPVEQSEHVSEIQAAIIGLLAEGHTDEAVAKRLGIGVRSCRGHIAKIYEAFDARSRFHLGILIAESGVLRQRGGAPVRASQRDPGGRVGLEREA
jgi:DNA-binding CsgD family transcriptional regulator